MNLLLEVNKYLKQNFKEIEKVPTKALLGMLSSYRRYEYNLYCSCCGEINSEEDRGSSAFYDKVKDELRKVLSTRENIPNKTQRKRIRQERGRMNKRKNNATLTN